MKPLPEIIKTIKLHLKVTEEQDLAFQELTNAYKDACNFISEHIFTHEFELNSFKLQKVLYTTIREKFGLKSQITTATFKTVTARYQTVQTQLFQNPYKYKKEDGTIECTQKTLDWLQKPLYFSRPQCDLNHGRDYAFLQTGKLSVNTMKNRALVTFDLPPCFKDYFDGTWKLRTAKLVKLNGDWYLHIPATKTIEAELDETQPKHVVGIDRGLRFIAAAYDETGKTTFFSGKEMAKKRKKFNRVRAELQAKGTKSAKRKLKKLSGRENRWMSDVNHQISKTLVQMYGEGTLFVIEDLTSVSFEERNLKRTKDGRNELRSWTFYQLEQFLTYKALEAGSKVLKVSAKYTSQRCPKCGRIHKPNRKHETHEYICDCCGYRSNDDRVGAMNIYTLGTMYVSGDTHPRFGIRKIG